MKLATFADKDGRRAGVVRGERVHPFPAGTTVMDLVQSGLAQALEAGAAAVASSAPLDLAAVRLLAPLQPTTLRDFVAFEEHLQGVRQSVEGTSAVPEAWYEAPRFYFTNPHAVIGPDDDVRVPTGCESLDLELEVAVVVGQRGASLSVEQARDVVFGYLVLNDWSARDLQRREMQVGLGPAKGKDFATTLGPWLVTADELDPYRDEAGFLDLLCTASVNDAEVGRDVLSNMGWTFESLIAYASRDTVVVPGDVIGSGTVGNGGCLAELWGRRGRQDPPPLHPGDVVTLTVEGIGSVTNTVVAGRPAPAVPGARRRDPAASREALLPPAHD